MDCDNDGVNDENDAENCDPHNDTDGDGFSNADEISCGSDPNDPNSYCKDFASINLEIVDFFSPNGDGYNDQWVDDSFLRYADNKVWIYSRSGQLVFEKAIIKITGEENLRAHHFPKEATIILSILMLMETLIIKDGFI